MIGIHAIAGYIPEGRESNFDKRVQFGLEEDFIESKIGVHRVSRKVKEEAPSDMCVKAFEALQGKAPVSVADVECLIVCTQNPDGGGIPHTAAIVHGKLKVPEACAAFDVGLGCSAFVYALAIATAFMEANGMKLGLLFTADPYSEIVDPSDRNTVLLFGDAATVTVLKAGAPGAPVWRPTKFEFATRGTDALAIHVDHGRLAMNGRAVFNFSATAVPLQVGRLLQAAGMGYEDVDLFVFHQGSKYIVDTLRKRLKLPPEKVPIKLADQGNTVSSSIPLILEDALGREGLRRILLSGFGVGLSWASCILEKQAEAGL